MTTQADRLANLPIEVSLTDGMSYQLSLGFGGLRLIEKEFGSARAMVEALSDVLGDGYYDAIVKGLTFGLWKTKMTEEQVEELLDTDKVMDYQITLLELLERNFPRQVRPEIRKGVEEAKAELRKLDDAEATKESTGTSATTSPPLHSVAQTKNSGT